MAEAAVHALVTELDGDRATRNEILFLSDVVEELDVDGLVEPVLGVEACEVLEGGADVDSLISDALLVGNALIIADFELLA
mgnify:CR=1 FL=1